VQAAIRDFAKRLIAHETRGNKSSTTTAPLAFSVIAKLRPTLANLMGGAGFAALLARALALASAEVRWLKKVQIKSDGSLQGPDELAEQLGPDELFKGQVVLLAQLLGLLVAFIGEKLTLQLVRETWPTLPAKDLNFSKE
jgi:hypothetical protein